MEINRYQHFLCSIATAFVILCGAISSVSFVRSSRAETASDPARDDPFLVVLGTAQDGGYPQAACKKICCAPLWEDPSRRRHVSCIAIIDPGTSQRWIIDATPDFKEQLNALDQVFPVPDSPGIAGIFLTHAHAGHYTGLMHLGREVMGTKGIPVYVLPRMFEFLNRNGPWDQLVRLGNISLRRIQDGIPVRLTDRLTITALLVPHRDEYTETACYRIDGPDKSALFLPDIDDWEKWQLSITHMISQVSVAYLDGTFYDYREIPDRNMTDIPHPFITESIKRFETLPESERAKVRFIHMNHTNPVLVPGSGARTRLEEAGLNIAKELEMFGL